MVGSCSSVDLLVFSASPEELQPQVLGPLCTVHAYADRTTSFRKSDQFFVSGAHKGKPVARHRLPHWLLEPIDLAHSSQCLQPPAGLRANSTIR